MKVNSLILLVLPLFFIFACNKENGKNEYSIVFNLDLGGSLKRHCIIFEKQKKYESGYGHIENLQNNKNGIVIQSIPKEDYFRLTFLKTEANYLAGQMDVDSWINWFWINGKEINGPLEMYGKYEKKGKVFTVDEGTFSVYWENAADYGEQPQLLTGTWTLKRK